MKQNTCILFHMQNPNSLYDPSGQRLYLTQDERAAFLKASKSLPPHERTLCTVLHDTGCRLSEALNLSISHVDLSGQRVVFETLKKRRRGVFRGVPVSDNTLDLLDIVHAVKLAGTGKHYPSPQSPLWTFSRTTAWRIVKSAMDMAEIDDGAHKSPKGLRHGFGINAVLSGVPVTSLQTWMGHSTLEITSIYLNAVGAEEREIAARMWN
jgi:integrase/recombinase XerD